MNDANQGNYVFAYPAALFAAWVLTWFMNLQLRARFAWTAEGDTVFWVVMKILIWIVPPLLIIHFKERVSISQFLEFQNAAQGMRWGCATGVVLAGITFVAITRPSGAKFRAPTFSLVLINAIVIAPVVEEVALRGFLLRRLQLSGSSFGTANILTTVTFVLMHLPGWYFQGRFFPLAVLAQPILSLAALSLLFGWTKHRSHSLYAALIAHALNNIYSSFTA